MIRLLINNSIKKNQTTTLAIMNNTSFLNAYLFIYRYWCLLKSLFFRYVMTRVMIVHIIGDSQISNVTVQYYLGIDSFDVSTYLVKSIDENSTHISLWKGYLPSVGKIRFREGEVKRKTVMMVKNKEPISFDMNVLDDFYLQTKDLDYRITNMSMVCRLLGIDCDTIKITRLSPFWIKAYDPKELDINELYYC